MDVSMAANPHDAYVTPELETPNLSIVWIIFRADKNLIVGISAVIISIFLAVALNKSLRHPHNADETDNMKADLQHVTGVSTPRQQVETMRSGNTRYNFISRLQQRRRGPYPTDSLTPTPSRSARHGSWEGRDNKCCV